MRTNIKIIILTSFLFAKYSGNTQIIDIPNAAKEAQYQLRAENIENAVFYYSVAVQQAMEKRNNGFAVDGDLLAEYAYALALHHDYEAALANIDKAWSLNAKYRKFFAAQILFLMNHAEASEQMFPKEETLVQKGVPEWINGFYDRMRKNHVRRVSLGITNPQESLMRANRLAANQLIVQSIALFEELMLANPDVYIIPVDYSALWETLGNYPYAIKLLDRGVKLMPKDSASEDNRRVFISHIDELYKKKNLMEIFPMSASFSNYRAPKLMIYAGASLAKDSYALNGRFGLFTASRFNVSLNVGINWMNDYKMGNVGLSAYKTWGIFFLGLGISDQINVDENIIGISPSIGITLLNKSQTSSFDISVGTLIPFSDLSQFSYSISLGKTIYLDMKGGGNE